MAHFRIELNGNSVEFKKTDSGMVEQELFALAKEVDAKFFLKGKPVSSAQVWEEISNIRNAWMEKKEQTHKQISVIDGVSGLKRKNVWIRK